MKKLFLYILLLSVTTATLNGFDRKTLYRNLFDLFKDTEFSAQGLARAELYDPDNDSVTLPTLDNKDFFKSINDLSICRRKSVRKFIYIYLTKGRKFVINSIKRSHNYMEIINTEHDEFPELPEEILLLPLLESGFNPFAVSRSRAVGLWQLMKPTSSILGLKYNKWVDERRNTKKSTIAALTHLKNIYPLFNSWELTLAAYNGGAGNVMKSIYKSEAKDFWKLKETGLLRKETNDFVPRFAALIIIYKNPHLFGLEKEFIDIKQNETRLVAINNSVDLGRLSRITGLKVKTIRKINPELKRNALPPYISQYNLRLPVEIIQKIDKNPENPFMIRYTRL